MNTLDISIHIERNYKGKRSLTESQLDSIVYKSLVECYSESDVQRGEIPLDETSGGRAGCSYKADIVVDCDKIAIECKGNNDIRKGIGQALSYLHYGYHPLLIAFDISERHRTAIKHSNIGCISIEKDGSTDVISHGVECSELKQESSKLKNEKNKLKNKRDKLEQESIKLDNKIENVKDKMRKIENGRISIIDELKNDRDKQIMEKAAKYKIMKDEIPQWIIEDYEPNRILSASHIIDTQRKS